MPHRNLPRLWLISDARNDAVLERALARLPAGSGFVFRHYHLPDRARRARFAALARIARARGHQIALAEEPRVARSWRADGVYGPPARIAGAHGLMKIATAHSLRELARAVRAGADCAMLSPVFATRSHRAARPLGPVRALLMARRSPVPVIALGGMTARHARAMPGLHGWAAIDGLSGNGLSRNALAGNPQIACARGPAIDAESAARAYSPPAGSKRDGDQGR